MEHNALQVYNTGIIQESGSVSYQGSTGDYLPAEITSGPAEAMTGDYWFTYPDIYHYYYHYWWPSIPMPPEKSKIEQAFKILKVLIEKKIVQINTVKRFIDTIDAISNVL